MDKDELKIKFYNNVKFLERNVPPDDIYIFAEQTHMAALYFLHKWSEWADIEEECHKDPIARKWVCNIMGLQKCKDDELDVNLDLDIGSVDEDSS